jgi:hypothetical protein
MADLSPFQSGYGSLQIFSVYQNVPKGIENYVQLTGLRQDTETAEAPGVFKEEVVEHSEDGRSEIDEFWAPGRRLPGKIIVIHNHFSAFWTRLTLRCCAPIGILDTSPELVRNAFERICCYSSDSNIFCCRFSILLIRVI